MHKQKILIGFFSLKFTSGHSTEIDAARVHNLVSIKIGT